MIELIFKRGKQPTLAEVESKILTSSSMTPNYTLISERGVIIFNRPEEIIQTFTEQRLVVVKKRYLVTLNFAPLERNRGSRAQTPKNCFCQGNMAQTGTAWSGMARPGLVNEVRDLADRSERSGQ